MAVPDPALPYLPEDVLVNVFSHLDKRKHLNRAMLVQKTWYRIAERMQYSDLSLDFLFGDLFPGHSDRPSRCLETLITRKSTSKAVRRLSVSGLSSGSNQVLLIRALTATTGLLSLEIQVDGNIIDEKSPWAALQSLWASAEFLPELLALNTNDARLVGLLAPGRRLHAIGIPELMDCETYASISKSLSPSSCTISQLRVYVEVDGMDAVIQHINAVAQTFPAIAALAIQFRLSGAEKATWASLKNVIRTTGSSLAGLHSLSTFGLAIIPDPADKGDGYDVETKRLANMIVEYVPQLCRIELRWHGWTITHGDEWLPVDTNGLLRQPRSWFYAETGPKYPFSRKPIG